ncbi:MAG TPA: GntR family transcriptional regulator [Tepidisphaeraceae bacterium]|jgi:DNA-binding LacI/PurR family transcriptional regulator|nr:GntR family transcriptional regulator [Tepidisphaeraceae bacterium]
MPTVELPKYERVKRSLIEEIENGRWAAGTVVPSEAELVQRFRVSRPTLVRSLQDLVRDGYVYRKQGKGTFVAERRIGPRPILNEVARQAATQVPVFVSSHTASLGGDAREVLLRMMRGIQSALGTAGQALVLRSANAGEIDTDTRRFLDTTEAGPALMIEPSFSPALRNELGRLGWTVWSINEPVDDGNCVFIDQEHAGYLATKYMLDHGRRRVALLNGPVDAYWGFGARLSGYKRALAEAGIAFDKALAIEGSHIVDSEAGRAMMRQLLMAGVAVDGVVGASDSKAIGAMAAAKESGNAVPEGIAFISIDNTLADRTTEPLPAVAMPFDEVGRQAAFHAIEPTLPGATPFFSQIQLKPTLVER